MLDLKKLLIALVILSQGACQLIIEPVAKDNGQDKETTTPPITPTPLPELLTYKCLKSTSSGAVSLSSLESAVDLTEAVANFASQPRVITGFGIDLSAAGISGIEVESQSFDEDMLLDSTSTLLHSDGNLGTNEIFVSAPEGYFISSVGIVPHSTGARVSSVYLTVSKANPNTNSFEQIYCFANSYEVQCGDEDYRSYLSSTGLGRLAELSGASNQGLVSLGASMVDINHASFSGSKSTLSFGTCVE